MLSLCTVVLSAVMMTYQGFEYGVFLGFGFALSLFLLRDSGSMVLYDSTH